MTRRLMPSESAERIVAVLQKAGYEGATRDEIIARGGLTLNQWARGKGWLYHQRGDLLVPVGGERYKINQFVTEPEWREWEANRLKDMGTRAKTESQRTIAAKHNGLAEKWQAETYQIGLERIIEDARRLKALVSQSGEDDEVGTA